MSREPGNTNLPEVISGCLSGLLYPVLMLPFILFGTACHKEPPVRYDLFGHWVDTTDGTVYRTIRLGHQVWMADNLNRGIMIDGSADQADNGIIEKYCYDNDPLFCEIFGGLYQWGEAMQYVQDESTRGICPPGWHIPSDNEWKKAEIFLGMTPDDADALFWRGHYQGLMLQQEGLPGFGGLPAGNRFLSGMFSHNGAAGYFWTSSASDDGHAWRRGINTEKGGIYRSANLQTYGFSVRCIKY